MEGWAWQTVHDPAMLPKVLERWQAAIAGGIPFEMEFPLRGGDGRFGVFLTRVVPAKNLQGRVVRWFGTNTDITELRRAEEVRERLAAVVEIGRASCRERVKCSEGGGELKQKWQTRRWR